LNKFVINLLDLVQDHFNEEEVKTLCFKLDVDYDSLVGNGKEGKIRELIHLFDRKRKIEVLIQEIIKSIPEIDPEIEKLREQISSESSKKYYHREDNKFSEVMQGPMPSSANVAEVLFISANPLLNLEIKKEYDIIKSRISESSNSDKIRLVAAHDLKDIELTNKLITCNADFIHFTGSAEDRKLILVNEKNDAGAVSFDAVTKIVEVTSRYKHIKCVFVNACNTASLAESLKSYVDCTIGVRGFISDAAAIKFAETFYTALSNGFNIVDSYALGINDLKLTHFTAVPKIVIKYRKEVNPSDLFLVNKFRNPNIG